MKCLSAGTSALLLGVVLGVSAVTTLWAQNTTPAPAAPAKVAPAGDAISHYRKAKDLFGAGKYVEAKGEVDFALQLDPNLQDAKLLANRIDAELARRPAATGTGAAVGPKDSLLTMEQIHRIRLFELSDKDTTIQAQPIPRKDLEAFWNDVAVKQAGAQPTPAAMTGFVSGSTRSQIQMIKDANATQFYDKIKISSDPANIVAFKRTVQPYLVQNCGSCHAGPDPHGYRIYKATGPQAERETYTNFYMLRTYVWDKARMIDRENPDQSLLLQYSLPKTGGATYTHPGNTELPTRFSGPSDQRYKAILAWINALTFPTPNYGITYVPVTTTAPAPTTAPAK